MLRSIKQLQGYKIHGIDGEIGKVREFLFDDVSWNIRYMVADTGTWLTSRLVLISPHALGNPDWEKQIFPVNLTKDRIENSPSIDTDKPVSRQMETDLNDYYGWPFYWTGLAARIPGAVPMQPDNFLETEANLKNHLEEPQPKGDPHLRSTLEVIDYKIQATDDEIGNVEDFIVEDGIWSIRYIVVDTGNWLLPGKQVLVSLPWIRDIDWNQSKVFVDLSKEEVRESPEFDPTVTINRQYEERLHKYYGKPTYWDKE